MRSLPKIQSLKKSWSEEVSRQVERWLRGEVQSYFEIRSYLSYSWWQLEPTRLNFWLNIGKLLSIRNPTSIVEFKDLMPPQTGNSSAIVVTFEPDAKALDNVKALKLQFNKLLIIDNSTSPNPMLFKNVQQDPGATVEVHYNYNHFGLAGALNKGFRRLHELQQNGWVFCFDQDTKVDAFFIESIGKILHSRSSKILTDSLFGVNYEGRHPLTEDLTEARDIITSGSFMRIENLKRCGLYIDELFIDSLDHEYCLRARRLGMKILLINKVLMSHQLGNSKPHSAFGKKLTVTNHSVGRWYYFARNWIFITLEGLPKSLTWGCLHGTSLLKNLFKVLLYEDNKMLKIMAVIRALFSGPWLFLFGAKKT